MLNKNAQVGETITWIIATVIIILILAVSIFLSSAYLGGNKKVGSAFFQSEDTLASKSLFSYMLTKNTEEVNVYDQLKLNTEQDFNEFNGELALEIFKGFYQKDYLDDPDNIWLGFMIKDENGLLEAIPNEHFDRRRGTQRGTEISFSIIPFTSEKILFDENRRLELVLIGK